jgi:phage terminase large subunit-like protein
LSHLTELTKSLVEGYSSKLTPEEQERLILALQTVADGKKYDKAGQFFQDTGAFRRELYPKHIDFFAAGAKYKQRGFIAGNQVGKSETGAFETRCHATGKYPSWWTGKRFSKPTLIWVGGDTAQTVRDIIQTKLVGGDLEDMGTGMLSRDDIIIEKCKTRRNVPGALEIIKVRHISGGESTIVLKTYEQGRATWQGTVIDFIWVDEECPEDVYGEALIRLMNSGGSIITTFTPLKGVTPLVLNFLDNDQHSSAEFPKYVGICTWDDVPHISEQTKAEMLAGTPPQLRDARSKGIPTVGTGMVYPVDPMLLLVDDFQIPKHFKKAYGMDVGWNCTAGLWGAWDVENDIRYLYSEHKQGLAEPIVHAKSIKARGHLKGQIDPASRGRAQADGKKLFTMYKAEGLWIVPANNAVESGIFDIYERMTTGRLKIFRSCSGLTRELSLYHRDDNGIIVKTNDHLLDCLRYLNNAPASAWQYPQDPRQMQQKKVVHIDQYMNACT